MHKIYIFIGKLLNYILLMAWNIRDLFNPPKSDAVLFVAHPDDDTLFFHSFLKEKKPYVCLMTTGWSLKRIPHFFKCMKQYGVKYRIYPLDAKEKRINLLEKQVEKVLSLNDFKVIATHNETGEYGHEEHKTVHRAVKNVCKGKAYDIYCPVDVSVISEYPLSADIVKEKEKIFKEIYVTETWVLYEEEAGTPVWVTNEKLEKIKI